MLKNLNFTKNLFLVFAISFSSISLANNSEIKKSETDMSITATILKPSTIEVVDHMDFGTVYTGTKDNKATGKFRVEHDKTDNVKVSYEGITINGNKGTILLMSKDRRNTTPLQVDVKFKKNAKESKKNNGTKEFEIALEGELDIPDNAASGEYIQIVTAKVTYN